MRRSGQQWTRHPKRMGKQSLRKSKTYRSDRRHGAMGSLKIHELPADERPRERLTAHGPAALSDSELIAILLRTGCVGANAIDVARQLLTEFGNVGGLARATVAELARIKGVGPAKAVQL